MGDPVVDGALDSITRTSAVPDIGRYRPGEEAGICRLFQLVFGKEKTLEQWRWQFAESSSEPHVFVARDANGEVIGQFACIPRRVKAGAHVLVFAQSVDSMVHPRHRLGLKKPGLFANIVQRYVDHFGHVEHEAFGYGMPNTEAYRIGHRLLGYTQLSEVPLHVHDLDDAGEPRAPAGLRVSVSTVPEPDHDALWQAMAPRFALATIRDRPYVEWRYAHCPTSPYLLLTARRDERLAALVVLRLSCLERDCATLVDFVWAGADGEALRTLIEHAEHLARRAGLHHIVTLLPPGAEELAVLSRLGYRPLVAGFVLVGRTYHAPLALDHIRSHWWYTFGDFDLI